MSPFFITTAIDYTNGAPHIGHAYEKILADVIARYRRQVAKEGEAVFFLTGVDQHGQKVQQSAEREGIAPQEFADRITQKFLDLWKTLGISYDAWAATTAPLHKEVVQKILTDLKERDWLYKDTYKGHYSVRQEQFLTDKERGPDGEFGPEWGEVVFLEEENWYFRLSRCSDWLAAFLEKQSDFVTPDFRHTELKNAAAKITGDLCVSRPKSRLAWGIEFPFDPEFVTYVWFDALINYISFSGYGTDEEAFQQRWPEALHLIGKDILIPAHGVYWPCMLHAMGFSDEQMPRLLVHGFWSLKGEKVSKSTGNIVDPAELAETYGVTALRYYLMRDAATGYDADFNVERLIQRHNTELGNGLGNLVNRTLSMTKKYREGSPRKVKLPEDLNHHLIANAEAFVSGMDYYAISQPQGALEKMTEVVNRANALVDSSAPWKLAKDPDQSDRLDAVLTVLILSARTAATMLLPVAPEAAEKILGQLKLNLRKNDFQDFALPDGYCCGEPTPVFPRLELPAPEPV
jgi:methionyl-tRNA synthetase